MVSEMGTQDFKSLTGRSVSRQLLMMRDQLSIQLIGKNRFGVIGTQNDQVHRTAQALIALAPIEHPMSLCDGQKKGRQSVVEELEHNEGKRIVVEFPPLFSEGGFWFDALQRVDAVIIALSSSHMKRSELQNIASLLQKLKADKIVLLLR
jgi:hypothetical protein